MLGDLNDRCTKWESSHSDSELGLKLVNLLKNHNLFQLINNPTRGGNIFDLMITDIPNYFNECGTLDPIDNLNHSPIFASLNIKYNHQPCYKREIRIINHDQLHLLKDNFKK